MSPCPEFKPSGRAVHRSAVQVESCSALAERMNVKKAPPGFAPKSESRHLRWNEELLFLGDPTQLELADGF